MDDVGITFGCDLRAILTCRRIGVVYNALPMKGHKDAFEQWAKEEYPELWERLEKRRRKTTMSGPRFDIVRQFEA